MFRRDPEVVAGRDLLESRSDLLVARRLRRSGWLRAAYEESVRDAVPVRARVRVRHDLRQCFEPAIRRDEERPGVVTDEAREGAARPHTEIFPAVERRRTETVA